MGNLLRYLASQSAFLSNRTTNHMQVLFTKRKEITMRKSLPSFLHWAGYRSSQPTTRHSPRSGKIKEIGYLSIDAYFRNLYCEFLRNWSEFFMETLEIIYLYVVPMDYAKSFWALHFTFNEVVWWASTGPIFRRQTSCISWKLKMILTMRRYNIIHSNYRRDLGAQTIKCGPRLEGKFSYFTPR